MDATSPRSTVATPARSRTDDTDRHVGAKIRERRLLLGLTQQELASLIGITYQQAHKYERGLNRVSAGRLYDIAQVLHVPAAHFFDGLEDLHASRLSGQQVECLELVRNFAGIEDENQQKALCQLARSLAERKAK